MQPKRLAIPDLEKYRRAMGKDIIYVNDLPMETDNDHLRVIDLIMTHYTEDYIPATRPADSPFMQDKKPSVWLRPPDGVDVYVVPRAWLIMRKNMTYKGTNVLRWLVDPQYRPPKEPMGPWLAVMELGLQRSYNAFVKNFDKIMEAWFGYLLSMRNVDDKDRYFKMFIDKYRKQLFVSALPIPNKMAFIRETNSTGDYGDTSVMTHAIDAVNTIASLRNVTGGLTLRKAENKTVKVIEHLAEFITRHDRENSSKKSGIYRKHFCGASMSFSARGIITSAQNTESMIDINYRYDIDAGMKHDEIYIPWGMGMELFKVHITTKLIRRGYTPMDISALYAKHTRYFSPLLKEIMDEVIREHPLGKFPCLIQRNPSLKRGSTQQTFIAGVKDDPMDNSFSISNLIITAMNADYDGDEENLYLCLDDRMYQLTKPLQPHYGIRDVHRPRRYCNHVQIPKPSIATLASWENASARGML